MIPMIIQLVIYNDYLLNYPSKKINNNPTSDSHAIDDLIKP